MFPEGKPTPHYFIAVFHCIVGILGGSHDMIDILPLKPGVSIITVGTMANDPSVQVKIVPRSIYFYAHRFRSRVVVEFGTAF